jgi:exopolysaccharide production protein ExoQ
VLLRWQNAVGPAEAVVVLCAILVGVLAGIDPRLGLAASMGLGFALIVLADLTIGLCAFALLAFLEAIPDIGGSALSFDKAAGGVLLLSWIATVASRPDARNEFFTAHPIFSYVLGAFVGWVALSALWAEDAGEVGEQVLRFTLNIFLFLIVFSAIRESKHLRWILGAFVAASALGALYGLLAPPQPEAEDRLAGFVGEPNQLAASLVAGLAMAVALAAVTRAQPMLRLLALVSAGLCLTGVLLTLSRAGLVGLAVAAVAAVFMAGRWRGIAAGVAVVVTAATVGYFAFYAPTAARERVTTFEGGTGRTDIWTVGWRMLEANPVAGVGAGNFRTASVHYLVEPGALLRDDLILDNPKVAHNIYLQELAELGIVGGTVFLAIVGFSLLCALKAARRFEELGDRDSEILARGVFVALCGILTTQFFASEVFSKQLWLLFGLSAAMLGIANRQLAAARRR